ncbi:MAG: HAMP domain-containing histidine kinase [Prolixibacteraceae bacterium]|jgi:two-component system phosphate regulon sensor histidine kinase PhoR|nr:HAMP domain-containing histidine kinase [Prolixibacteraceae bacterium]
MSQLKRRILVLIALVSILLLLGLQVHWLLYSYRIEEALFSKSVRVALNQSISTLSKDENMCQSMQKSISCDSSFRASRNHTPHVWQNLDRQIRDELALYDIDLDYDLAIFKGKDTLKINDLDQLVGASCYRLSLKNALKISDTEIGVVFPNRYKFFMHRMGMMFTGSVLLILLIGFSFFLVIRYYLKEISLSESIKEMVNNLAHEFRTPISSISLAAKMINQTPEASPDSKIRKYADTIIEENKRLQRQSDHILQLAAIEQNNLAFRFETLDLTNIIEEAIRSIEIHVEQCDGKIIRKFGEGLFLIRGDHHELVHVLINLLANACKYSPELIEITILLKNTGKGIQLSIIDKGIGITSGEKKKIFDKYYRIPSGNQHDTKGFGIGLYYVKEILKAHHASIDVESEPGKGSNFSILFPKEQEENGTKN